MLGCLFADLSMKINYVLGPEQLFGKTECSGESHSFGLFVFPLNYIVVCMDSGLRRGDLETSSIFQARSIKPVISPVTDVNPFNVLTLLLICP